MIQTAPFFLYFIRLVFRQFRNPTKPFLRPTLTTKPYQKFSSFNVNDHVHPTAVVIDVEGALLKSTCLFPYFMIVAFEAGSFLRALLLLLLYPILRILGGGGSVKLMTFVSFFGLRKDGFKVGRSVLPKFLLDDVGLEAFETVNKKKRKKVVVGVCGKLPRVMVESFLKDYLEFDHVVAGEIKVVGGYFLGTLDDVHNDQNYVRRSISGDAHHAIGIARFTRNLDDHPIFALCKEIYLVRTDKNSWRDLPPHRYPNPLIFHDGRLAVRPTFVPSVVVLMWTPFGFLLALVRLAVALTLPFSASIPVLTFLGFRTVISGEKGKVSALSSLNKKGQLYVCNHRTLLDPLYLSFALKSSFTAVTYSISRVSEMLSPIRTVRLSRDRARDAEMMEGKLLRQQDLVVCPEGTTCREPYLLRFSPLFAELTDEIVPVALDVHVDMFYGTTASGLKCLDPLFFLLNPRPEYSIRVLDPVSTRGQSSYDVANFVQREIGNVLGFQCTKLTRKDKYLVLAGNEGIHRR